MYAPRGMDGQQGLRVLHLTTSEETFFEQQIATLEKRGVTCDVAVVPGQEQIDGDLGARRGLAEYVRFLPRVRSKLAHDQYDLVHANYGLTAPYAVLLSRLPVVLTLWGSDVIGLDGLVTKAFAWRCDAVTVRSREMRELLGISAAHIVPSGVDLERFRPLDTTAARENVGWTEDGYHVLFPYSPGYERKRYPLAESVVDRASERVERNVTLHTVSGVAHEEMVHYVNAADALLLTSRHEGSPNTVKEALACNVPVVSTDVGDVRERLAGVSPSAVCSTPAELVAGLVDVLRSGHRSNGREAVEPLSWDNIGAKLVRIYEDIV